jgi:hypothetical protein
LIAAWDGAPSPNKLIGTQLVPGLVSAMRQIGWPVVGLMIESTEFAKFEVSRKPGVSALLR